jgi:hypothetical protein
MKKLFIALAFLSAGSLVQAQISKGTLFFGGDFGILTTTDEFTGGEDKTTDISFGPKVGYFVADDLAAGIGLGITSSKYEPDGGGEITESTFDILLFLKKFWMSSDEFGVTGALNVGIGSGKIDDGTNEVEMSSMDINVSGGVIWFPIPVLGLTAEVGMLGMSTSEMKDTDDKSSTIGLMLDPAIQFSFCYFPGR